MKIKRTALFAALMLAAVMIFGTKAYAEDDLSLLARDSGINDTVGNLPYDAADFLRENGISADNPTGISELTPSVVMDYMWSKLTYSASVPFRTGCIIISVIIMAAASGAAADAVAKGGSEKVYRTVTVLAAVAVTVPPLEECIQNASETLVSGSEFMLCYVPVFAGISAAAGNVTSAASYNVTVFVIAEAAARIAADVLMPVISVCMAMNIVDSVNPDMNLSAVTGLLKKWSAVIMGFIMTVFTGLLSIQSIVGVSADSVGVKAAKFMVSNLIPVVGGAVADAYTTMRSGLGLLRGTSGAFGIIALAVTLLPPILETGCYYIALTAGEAIAELFGVKQLAQFFRGSASVISLATAALACFGVMFVISTVILMAAGLGST